MMEEGPKEGMVEVLVWGGLLEMLPAMKKVMGVASKEAVLLEEREHYKALEEKLSELYAQIMGGKALNMRKEGVLLGGEAREKAPDAQAQLLRWNRARDLR